MVDPAWLGEVRATLFLYEDDVEWCCGDGGQDIWDWIVRAVRNTPVDLDNVGDQTTVTEVIDLDPGWIPENLRAVAILQMPDDPKTVYQATYLPSDYTPAAVSDPHVASRSGMLDVSPNPFDGSTEIAFSLPVAESRRTVQLILLDASGRQVRSLYEGVPGTDHHRVVWDGRDYQGRLAASGIYFARLMGVEGAGSTKLVLRR